MTLPTDLTSFLELLRLHGDEAFKLLRPLPLAEQTYLVPAMLPRSELPPEYTTPLWWCPSKASGAAVVCADMAVRAEMRIVYEVLGGSLPFGFMSELQVSLVSLSHSESVEEELTSASETAVVDRMCGTVLSEAYECGGGEQGGAGPDHRHDSRASPSAGGL